MSEPVLPGCGRRTRTGSTSLAQTWSLGRKLFNAYGPTETSVCATISAAIHPDLQTPPAIGRPIDNVTTYVLDRFLQPVPVAVFGQLYIAGWNIRQPTTRIIITQ